MKFRVAWIALPTAVDYVVRHIRNKSSKHTGLQEFLLNLRSRYQSAKFVSLLLDEAIKELRDESVDDREGAFFELIYYALQQPAYEDLYLQKDKAGQDPAEADLLDRVVNFIDFGLANDIKGLNIGPEVTAST